MGAFASWVGEADGLVVLRNSTSVRGKEPMLFP